MQQSEISSIDLTQSSQGAKISLKDLIQNLSNEKDSNKKREIYRKIEFATIGVENINSAEIHQEMESYFSKIIEANEFDKKLMKLMLTRGLRVSQDFIELDSLNIKEGKNDFFLQDIEIKIQDYKKIYANSPIKIEEQHTKIFLESLKIIFEYFQYCLSSNNENEVEYNKKNILRVNVNGIELGFSALGLCDFLENIVIKKGRKELSFSQFINGLEDKTERQYYKDNFVSLQHKCLVDKEMARNLNFAKEVLEGRADIRSSIESLKKRGSQDFSSRRSSFQDFFRNSSVEKNSLERKVLALNIDVNCAVKNKIANDQNPNCCSFLKVIFYKFFNAKPQQKEEKQIPLEISVKPDTARNPRAIVHANSFFQPHLNGRDDIMLER